MQSSTQRVQNLLQWIETRGGYVHPSVVPQLDPVTGLSAFAQVDVATDERLVSCPFSLAVAPELATEAVCSSTGKPAGELVWPAGSPKAGEKWNDRMRIGAYLGLHWAFEDGKGEGSSKHPSLIHQPYIDSLPSSSDLSTPLFFTEPELELLRGTNLYGAVEDRRKEWRGEWEAVREVLQSDGLTWDRYLATATYLSSRAFPSKLLRLPDTGSFTTSAVQTSDEEGSHPVLLPGVDLFNHSRGHPIVWLSSETPSSFGPSKTLSLVTARSHSAGEQLFNNYGPKPNEELLLAYGFVIPDNPDDVVALKVGPQKTTSTQTERLQRSNLVPSKRYFLKRDGKLDPDLLGVLRILLSPDDPPDEAEIDSEDEHALHEQEERSMQLELDVLGTLGQMLDDKLEKLEQVPALDDGAAIREDVREMCAVYRKGQVDIVTNALEKIEERIRRLEGLMDQGMGGCPCCA